jgi:PAS domain-containing protein
LFVAAGEPVIVVDARNLRIVASNPAAATLFRTERAAMTGHPFLDAFDAGGARLMRTRMRAVRADGGTMLLRVRSAVGVEMHLKLSGFKTGFATYFLIRRAPGARAAARPGAASVVFRAIDDAAMGFVLTDSEFRIEYANRSFSRMVNLEPAEALRGLALARWLPFGDADLARLGIMPACGQATAELSATLRSEKDFVYGVAVRAVSVPDEPLTPWGFCVRELGRLN